MIMNEETTFLPVVPHHSKYQITHLFISGVEERKEKAKSTPLLSSHEDLAKGKTTCTSFFFFSLISNWAYSSL